MNALLTGLIVGLLAVIGVLVVHPLPWPGVGTPPVPKPVTAVASSPAPSEVTCNAVNMPAAPVLLPGITEPGPGGKFVWASGGKPYYCFMHDNNFKLDSKPTGCPLAAIVTQEDDGDYVAYSFVYSTPAATVFHLPYSMVKENGLSYAFTHSPYKPETRSIGGIPKSARDLLSILTEGYPLDKTSCENMN